MTKHSKCIFHTGSGTIDFDELKTVLLSCMEESSMKLSNEDINDLTRALFNEADEDGSGEITFEELVAELDKYPDIRDNLTMRYIDLSQLKMSDCNSIYVVKIHSPLQNNAISHLRAPTDIFTFTK